jgi:hypothetical protein
MRISPRWICQASASTIAASTIAASTIAASTIAASTIAASTIAASTIAASTIAASTIAASTIAAFYNSSFYNSSFDNSTIKFLEEANQIGLLDFIRDDYWAILIAAGHEVPGIRAAIIEGRIDGSAYEGTCACLCGTIANIRGVNYKALEAIKPNSNRPVERFFANIKKGDTPETNISSKYALQWLMNLS